MILDAAYWCAIFVLYTALFVRLIRYGWFRYFPIFCVFLGQQIVMTCILLSFTNGTWHYFYAYFIGKGIDIVTGILSLIELSRCKVDAVTYTLAFYFIIQFGILAVAAPLHWYQAEQLIKPLAIGFLIVWNVTFRRLRLHVLSEIRREFPAYQGDHYVA
jgi:hypothetical protein